MCASALHTANDVEVTHKTNKEPEAGQGEAGDVEGVEPSSELDAPRSVSDEAAPEAGGGDVEAAYGGCEEPEAGQGEDDDEPLLVAEAREGLGPDASVGPSEAALGSEVGDTEAEGDEDTEAEDILTKVEAGAMTANGEAAPEARSSVP